MREYSDPVGDRNMETLQRRSPNPPKVGREPPNDMEELEATSDILDRVRASARPRMALVEPPELIPVSVGLMVLFGGGALLLLLVFLFG